MLNLIRADFYKARESDQYVSSGRGYYAADRRYA